MRDPQGHALGRPRVGSFPKKVVISVFLRFSKVPARTQGVTMRMSWRARRADGWGCCYRGHKTAETVTTVTGIRS
jgi:hypothetical protein